jgi:hypothetical protein
MRLVRGVVLFILLVAGACGGSPSSPSKCCTVCKTGKPCGDSCISASETCHTSGGCACSG